MIRQFAQEFAQWSSWTDALKSSVDLVRKPITYVHGFAESWEQSNWHSGHLNVSVRFASFQMYAKCTQGHPFRIQLGQYRDHLLHLKTRWSSPLASSIRFDSHVADASLVAARLTGHLEPSFKWAYVTNALDAGVDGGIQDDEDQLDENLPHHDLSVQDEEERDIVASEIFEQDESDDDEDPPQDDDIVFLEVSQAKKTGGQDVSIVEDREGAMSFCWALPVRFEPFVERER